MLVPSPFPPSRRFVILFLVAIVSLAPPRATARADEALRSGTLREHEIAAAQARALTNRVERIEVELGVLRYAVGTTDADVAVDVTAA